MSSWTHALPEREQLTVTMLRHLPHTKIKTNHIVCEVNCRGTNNVYAIACCFCRRLTIGIRWSKTPKGWIHASLVRTIHLGGTHPIPTPIRNRHSQMPSPPAHTCPKWFMRLYCFHLSPARGPWMRHVDKPIPQLRPSLILCHAYEIIVHAARLFFDTFAICFVSRPIFCLMIPRAV